MVGELNKMVTFNKNTPNALGSGSKGVYTLLLTTWGSLKKYNGNRSLSYGEIFGDNSYEIVVRYQVELANNLRMDTRIEIEGRVFTIASFEKVGEKKFYYKFRVNEQVK